MKCDNCIHKSVCYKIGSIPPAYSDKCGDFKDDNSIVPIKPMVEIDLYSVIKQKYIERDILDKIKAEFEEHAKINQNLNPDRAKALCWCLDLIDKYMAESEAKDE